MTDVTQPPAYEPTQSYQLTVNGQTHDIAEGWLGESLLYVLRERLGLPGAKNACEQGECGSCSVMVGGTLVCSCLVPAATVGDQPVCRSSNKRLLTRAPCNAVSAPPAWWWP